RLFDRFPALFERSEVPPLAAGAHDPKAALRRVEGEAFAYRERLERFVTPKWLVAEQTRCVHRRPDNQYRSLRTFVSRIGSHGERLRVGLPVDTQSGGERPRQLRGTTATSAAAAGAGGHRIPRHTMHTGGHRERLRLRAPQYRR